MSNIISKDFEKDLHERGFRITPQRRVVLRILQEADEHLTPAEVYQRANQLFPGFTEATVYRSLNFLAAEGLVLAAHIGSGQLVYEIGGYNHHHLICRNCRSTCAVEHEVLEILYRQLAEKTGYQIDSVHVTFFGLCPDCKEQKRE